MVFSNKKILIISPQPWSDMFVSKHHYAIELSKKNNNVYFLQPSSNLLNKKIELKTLPDHPNITIIHHKTFFGAILRFHVRTLYKFLLKRNLKNMLKKLKPIDVIISFDNTGTYPDLSLFEARHNIFFPVDQINLEHLKEYKNFGRTIFSISSVILDSFLDHRIEKVLLNHGLGSNWALNAINNSTLSSSNERSKPIRVGYFGNLAMGRALDINTLTKVIDSHPEIEFHFWGNYEVKKSSEEEVVQWIVFLKDAKNVTLYGATPPNKLINQVDSVDAFLLCYNYHFEINKCSNSHKILEYLSTGKVIISSKISRYEKNLDLMSMLTEYDNKDFNALFEFTINNLDKYNSDKLRRKRIDFALDNTYEKQINRIENHLKKQI